METTTLLVIRHGHVEGIDPPRFRGRTDVSLTSRGEAQAAAAARTVATGIRPVAIYTSPLRRCIMTGAAIARACKIAPKVLETLNDINYGTWQWKTPDEVRERTPEMLALWYAAPQLVRPPGGESLQDVAVRAADAIRFALDYHRGERIVYVTHDTLIRVMLLQLLDTGLGNFWKIAQDPCAINEVRLSGADIRIQRVNDSVHLIGIQLPL
jgi:broad specificity phosphatase PhoE